MAKPLTAQQAYLAGRDDAEKASGAAQRVLERGRTPDWRAAETAFMTVFLSLWKERIKNGELSDDFTKPEAH